MRDFRAHREKGHLVDDMEAMRARHSVRSYTGEALDACVRAAIEEKVAEVNGAGGLHVQLVADEPRAFSGLMAHYGKFSGVTNYLAMIGARSGDLEERVGYYGEELVLACTKLGLGTCWVAMTYSKVKGAFDVGPGEKLVVVISLGRPAVQGTAHTSKAASRVSETDEPGCEWFERGVEAALLAPTAMNQQQFTFSKTGDVVRARAGLGFFAKVDLGIAKLHFELGAGRENFTWG